MGSILSTSSGASRHPDGVGRGAAIAGVAGTVALLAGLLTGPGSASAAAATFAPRVAATQDVCGIPAPGQLRCLSVRRTDVVEPAGLSGRSDVAAPASTPYGYGPADLTAAYGLDPSRGSGQTVALVDAYDSPTAESDLAAYRAQYGLPACTTANGCFRKVNQAGTTSPMPAANSGWAAEISLDVDMVSAVCPQCNILLVEANSSYTSDLGAAVDTAVALGAKFVSNSYGGGDSSGQAYHFDHPGVVMTASTGDNGYGVSFPASAPTVTAVGGTSLTRSATSRGWSESAWGGSGSGCSAVFAKPAIQNLVTTGCANRAVADVSAVADPGTGVAVYLSGGWGVFGGTSASSPIISAVYALAGTPGAGDYPNTYPYQNSDSLNDVVTGSNGSCGGTALCGSRAGWDGPTGLGTPNGAAAFSPTGAVGPPTKLGATVTLGSPVVPGVSTTAAVNPVLPPNDAVTSIAWKSARADCTFSAPTLAQTSVSCPATATGTTTVTATVKDTAGSTKVVTMPLAFAGTSPKRGLTVTFGVAGQSGSPQSVCTSATTPLRATVTDTATGQPVKGVFVNFARQAGAAAPIALARGTSGPDGVATSTVSTTTALTLSAGTTAVGPFNAATAGSVAVTAAKCTPKVTAGLDRNASYYGDPVTVGGVLTRPSAAGDLPLAGAPLTISETAGSKVTALGKATAAADGSYTAVVHPTASGTVSVALAATTSWTATTAGAGTIAISLPSTAITATLNATDVGYAAPVLVSGTLTRNAGGDTAPVSSGTVTIRSTSTSGAVSSLGTAPVLANGTWKATVMPRASATVTAVYAGTSGQPAAATTAGSLTVGTWTSALTLTAAASQQVAGAANRVSGTVTRSYAGATGAAPSVPVRIYLQTTTGANVLLSTVSTSVTGAFTVPVTPAENGTLVAKVMSVPGYLDAASSTVPVTVTTKLTVTAPLYVLAGNTFAVSGTVLAPRALTVTLDSWNGSVWTPVSTATSTAAGLAKFPLTGGVVGKYTYRLRATGDARGADAVSATFTVTVR